MPDSTLKLAFSAAMKAHLFHTFRRVHVLPSKRVLSSRCRCSNTSAFVADRCNRLVVFRESQVLVHDLHRSNGKGTRVRSLSSRIVADARCREPQAVVFHSNSVCCRGKLSAAYSTRMMGGCGHASGAYRWRITIGRRARRHGQISRGTNRDSTQKARGNLNKLRV